jgi:putative membrane protein
VIYTDETFSRRVEAAVTEIESRTDAELVVVVAPRSASYRDLAYAVATALTYALLLALEAMPFAVHPWAVVADLTIAWPLTAWLATSDWVTRLLLRTARARTTVRESAEAEFYREGVHATPNRTGLLIYMSALEGRVEIVQDIGLEAAIPQGRFAHAALAFSENDLEHFLAGLLSVGDVLAAHVPHTATSDDVNLPNAPRIRP